MINKINRIEGRDAGSTPAASIPTPCNYYTNIFKSVHFRSKSVPKQNQGGIGLFWLRRSKVHNLTQLVRNKICAGHH